MLFKESKDCKEDLSVAAGRSSIVDALLLFVLRRPMTVARLLVQWAGCRAELGLLTLFGHRFTVIDAIAIPVIMAVAVDGAFWYSVSSRSRRVRRLFLVAMVTTVGAVSLPCSPSVLNAVWLVMIVGILLDWFVAGYVLERSRLLTRNHRVHPRKPRRSCFRPL